MRALRPLLFLLAALLAAPVAATAAERFRILILDAGGRISESVRTDLDGDGRAEVILISGRRAVIHRPTVDETPWRLDLPADATGLDIGQVDGVPETREIVVLTPNGLVAHLLKDGRPAPKPTVILRAGNIARAGPGDALRRRAFLHDLDGDGLADAVLPTGSGFALFHQGRDPDGLTPGRWPVEADAVVPFVLRSTWSAGSPELTGQLHGSAGIPGFRVLDLTGDGANEFVVRGDRTLSFFSAGESGRLDTGRPSAIDLAPLAGDSAVAPSLAIRDLTGDGVPEFLVARRGEGIVEIYEGGTPPAAPAMTLRFDGEVDLPWITDVDADGRPDLVVPVTPPVAPVAALRLVATGATTVTCHIYLNTGEWNGPETGEPVIPFRERADLVRPLSAKIRLYVDGAGRVLTTRKFLAWFNHDFSGDGRPDLVHYQGGSRLAFYAGTVDGVFREEPWLRVKVPGMDDAETISSEIADLDADGRDDLVITCLTADGEGDRVVLLLAPGGKK